MHGSLDYILNEERYFLPYADVLLAQLALQVLMLVINGILWDAAAAR
jgi:hypothetical protein